MNVRPGWHEHRHRHQHGELRSLNPVARYMRARLHRRIFVWFGISIALTFAAAALMMTHGPAAWRQTMSGGSRFVGWQFERVWDDAGARAELARTLAKDLNVDVTVHDPKDDTRTAYGAFCQRPELHALVQRGSETLGDVDVCFGQHWPVHPWRFWGPFALATLVLWGASGRIARRLTRPLGELTRVTQEIGAGNLGARARLHPFAHGEAGVLGQAINDMAGRIEKQLADQRELLAAVSHELRTPLARIRILTELARTGGADPKTLDELDREVVEIDRLVGDLLAKSRMDFSALQRTELEVASLARRALERAGVSEETLVVEAPVLKVQGDATLLARALANLLDNAQRHGGGATALRVKAPPGCVAFEVEDRGPGFAEGAEARAFEAFHHRGNPKTGGLGLGLSLVKRIAEAHGGRAYAENLPGGGARVGFEIRA